MSKQRAEIAKEDKWNVEALYPSVEAWKKEFDLLPPWSEIEQFKGRLAFSPTVLKEALEIMTRQARQISKLYTYAHLRHDENIADDQHKIIYNQAITSLHALQESLSWFEPELLSLPSETLDTLLSDPSLKDYRFHLEKIIRLKPHTLSKEQERTMALVSRALQTAHKTFSALNDADFDFGVVQDSSGEEHKLSHATMHTLMRSRDRLLRKNTFLSFHQHYANYGNTLAELLNGQVQAHLFTAKARGYKSCLEAAIYPKNIDEKVYHTLIDTVSKNLSPLHRYHKLRGKVLNLSEIHLYDMIVPLTPNFDIQMSYDEAEKVVIDSTAPLGSEYQQQLHRGLKTDRWVDRYDNKNKRSGAYSSGCYDSVPYILMNFKGYLRDVFTLAHEAGHSMHSLLSHTHQPYHYADYPIFLAEVASTFNEELLTVHLLETVESVEEKIFLVNQKIEDIRGTFFRQTMFAEFELLIHEAAEKGQPLTPAFLNEAYGNLLHRYFGPDVIIDAEAKSEWARIPHFYYNFYVYQYATGISAALALAEKVLKGGDQDREAYLTFLKSGSSKYPLELLKAAGVDMHTPDAVEATARIFTRLVDQLEGLLEERLALKS